MPHFDCNYFKKILDRYKQKFRFQLLIRKNDISLIGHLVMLGYEAEYMSNYEYNIAGRNIVTEHGCYHATDSDNKPHCIDCGENDLMFRTLAAIKTTDIVFINTDGFFITDSLSKLPEGTSPATDEEIVVYFRNAEKDTAMLALPFGGIFGRVNV